MNTVKYIVKKEFARIFKDKKMIFSLFVLPVVIMIAVYGIIGVVASAMMRDIEEHVSVVYIENVPQNIKQMISLTGYDKLSDITYVSEDADETENIKNDILNGDADLYVVFDKDFDKKIGDYGLTSEIPGIKIKYNSAKDYSTQAYSVFEAYVLEPYRDSVIAQRIGGAEFLTVFETDDEVIVDEDEAKGKALAMFIPYIIIILVFSSAMGLVVDAIAGEKERGTLASLLMTPAERSMIATGKITALTLLSMLSSLVYAVSMALGMPFMSNGMVFGTEENITIDFSFIQIIEIVLCLVTLAYLCVAMITILSVFAKDVKTASSLVSPLYIVIMMAAMVTMFTGNFEPGNAMFLIPVFGTAIAIQNIMINTLTVVQFMLTLIGNIIFAGIITYGVTRAFDSEKIMFNA